jgi:hypothetical protein
LSAGVFLNGTLRLVWLSLIGLVSLIEWFVLAVLILPVHLPTLATLLVHLIVLVFLVLLILLVILILLVLVLLIMLILALVIAGCLLIILALVVHIRLVLLVLVVHAGLVIHTGLVLLIHLVILVLLILLGSLTFAISLRIITHVVGLVIHRAPTLTINDYRKFGRFKIAAIMRVKCF